MHKSYDYKLKSYIVNIYAGECYIGGENEIISTVLGSCVAICLHDVKLQIGGMIHYLLPLANKKKTLIKPLNFGDKSFDFLIESLLKKGANEKNLVAKIFGGANVISIEIENKIGELNIIYAKKMLEKRNIKVLSEDVGGVLSRKIFFFPGKNKVFLKEVM